MVAKIEDTGGTAVELAAFRAEGEDRAVRVDWETASELDNLGFHLYRSLDENGPYRRITTSLIPGLGSSPEGARYQYLDSGLANGTTYFYKLEDIETTGSTEMHGPVGAKPVAGGTVTHDSDDPHVRLIFGNPSATSMRVAQRGPHRMVLELETAGFFAEPHSDGTVELSVPGVWNDPEPDSPALPSFRSWLEVPAETVRIAAVREKDIQVFSSLRLSPSRDSEIVATRQGVVRPRRYRKHHASSSRAERSHQTARVVSTGYQGQVKKAQVELSPFRWNPEEGRLIMARRLRVRLSFSGRERADRPRARRGDRRHGEGPRASATKSSRSLEGPRQRPLRRHVRRHHGIASSFLATRLAPVDSPGAGRPLPRRASG